MDRTAILREYVSKTLGQDLRLVQAGRMAKLPLYVKGTYTLYQGRLLDKDLLFALGEGINLTVGQMARQMATIRETTAMEPVLVLTDTDAITRKRLIEQRLNFIVPGKQLYLPDLAMDLREDFGKQKPVKGKLLPSAQVVLIYAILHRKEPLETWTMKQWATKLHYTAMAISQAANNLKAHGLCEVKGTKEKFMNFGTEDGTAMFKKAEPLLIDPVLARMYVDKLPLNLKLLKAGETALPEYTNMNAGRQETHAMAKEQYHALRKKQALANLNEREGAFCIEIWKYNPAVLVPKGNAVDHISLYLSMRQNTDERIQMALGELADLW